MRETPRGQWDAAALADAMEEGGTEVGGSGARSLMLLCRAALL